MARVLVTVAEGSEELEAVTIIDLLRRAELDVTVAGLAAGPLTLSRGVVLQPDTTVAAVAGDDFDMLVLPGGGAGAKRLRDDADVQALLKRHSESGKVTAAICAAPSILAHAGLLEGKQATSFPGWLDEYTGFDYSEAPVVVDGQVVTSRGPGTAMDFALRLIEILKGAEAARAVEETLQRPAGQQVYG